MCLGECAVIDKTNIFYKKKLFFTVIKPPIHRMKYSECCWLCGEYPVYLP